MKITLCGSLALINEMNQLKTRLEELSHEVQLPPSVVKDEQGNPMPVALMHQQRHASTATSGWVWDTKEQAMRDHFSKVEWCDAVLVVNEDKSGVANYVGGNTLIEMGVAFYLKKKIFLLKPVPEVPYKEEIIGMKPTVIQGDLLLLR